MLLEKFDATIEAFDLIWDKSLDIPYADRFLGAEKYEPEIRAIYAGLGIPSQMLESVSLNDMEGSRCTS